MALLPQLGSSLSKAVERLFQSPLVDERVIDDCLKQVCTALLQADVNVKLVQDLRTRVKTAITQTLAQQAQATAVGMNKPKLVHRLLVEHLCRLVDPFSGGDSGDGSSRLFAPKHGSPSVIMFVGLQGSGKTTSLSKLAAWYRRNGFRVAVVAGDTFRAGAFDQLRQNALKAGVAFYGDPGEDDPVVVCRDGVSKFRQDTFEVILVDTSGRHRQESALFAEMQLVKEAVSPDQIILCMDASIGQAAEQQARAFAEAVPVGAIFLTKLDSEAKGGGALSAVAACHAPIAFVGTGEHLTDVEPFVAKTFVHKLLGMGDLRGLVDAVQRLHMDEPAAQEVQARVLKGQFTLRDMQVQFQMVAKLGPLSQLMSMIPGMSQMLPESGNEDPQAMMRRFLIILDSMHRSELDSDGKPFHLQPNRLQRVAKGAGCTIADVKGLLEQYRMASTMLKRMTGGGGLNPGAIDPRMLARFAPALDGQDIPSTTTPAVSPGMPSSLVAAKRAQRHKRSNK